VAHIRSNLLLPGFLPLDPRFHRPREVALIFSKLTLTGFTMRKRIADEWFPFGLATKKPRSFETHKQSLIISENRLASAILPHPHTSLQLLFDVAVFVALPKRSWSLRPRIKVYCPFNLAPLSRHSPPKTTSLHAFVHNYACKCPSPKIVGVVEDPTDLTGALKPGMKAEGGVFHLLQQRKEFVLVRDVYK